MITATATKQLLKKKTFQSAPNLKKKIKGANKMHFSLTTNLIPDLPCALCEQVNSAQLTIEIQNETSNYDQNLQYINFCITHIFDFNTFAIMQDSAFKHLNPYISDILTILDQSKNMELESAKNSEFLNLAHNLNSLLEKKIKLPIVIIAPGNSLCDNIEFLKKNKEVIFSIALNSAYDVCNEYNYNPDAVIMIDGHTLIEKQFKNYSYGNTLLFFSPNANNNVVKKFTGLKFPIFNFDNDFMCLFAFLTEATKTNCDLLSAYSVIVTALSLATKLTDERIYLIGTDLSFSTASTHDPKSAITQPIINAKDIPYNIKCYDSQERPTFYAFLLTAKFISEHFQDFANRIFQTSEKSAMLENIKCITLANEQSYIDSFKMAIKPTWLKQINYTDRLVQYNDKLLAKLNLFLKDLEDHMATIEHINIAEIKNILEIKTEEEKLKKINETLLILKNIHEMIFAKSKWMQIYNNLNNQLNLFFHLNSSVHFLQNITPTHSLIRYYVYFESAYKNMKQLLQIVLAVKEKIKSGTI